MSDDDLFGFDPDRVGDAVRQPPLASLRQRAQARRRRRNVLTGSGAVALALVLIGPVALPFTAGLTGPDHPEHVEPPATVGDLVVLDERTAVGVELTMCTVRFTRTLDGGQTWSPYKGVDHSQRCILDAEGHGISDIRYQILGDRSYLYFMDGRAYLTEDAGQNWQDADSAMTVVDSFPAGAQIASCSSSCLAMQQPLAVDPTSGDVYRLRSEPPGLDLDRAGPGSVAYPIRSLYVSPDGAIWTVFSPSMGPPALIRSVDRGATWQQSPRPPAQFQYAAVAARSGREAYALIVPTTDEDHAVAPGPTRLLRTDDGGATWEEVPTDLPHTDHGRPFTVAADGALLVADGTGTDAGVWISRDGGAHFTAGPAVPGGVPGSAPGRVWIGAGEHLGPAQVTEDGEHWRPLPLPWR